MAAWASAASQKALSGPARGPHGQHGGSQPGPAGQVLRAYPPRRPVHLGAGRAARRSEAWGSGGQVLVAAGAWR
jgi:hypothetical protein